MSRDLEDLALEWLHRVGNRPYFKREPDRYEIMSKRYFGKVRGYGSCRIRIDSCPAASLAEPQAFEINMIDPASVFILYYSKS